MLDSFRNFVFISNYVHLKSYAWKREWSFAWNFFKITKVTKLTKVIQESSSRVLQVPSKSKTLKQPVYFLKAVELCPTFDTQIDITFAIFREK